MARVVVVYHRFPYSKYWRPTYTSHLTSFDSTGEHSVLYVNTAWLSVPGYLKRIEPDFVIFHYTFLAARLYPDLFDMMLGKIDFMQDWSCGKALVPHDEQACSAALCRVAKEFGVTHVFTPASEAAWPMIYEGLDFERVKFRTVLTGYVDEETVRRTAARAERSHERTIDIGYRAWASWPFYGRHGRLKTEVGDRVKARAAEHGLNVDISKDAADALLGDSWFDFLLRCKYTIGCEGGSSVFDRDGTIATCVDAYMAEHEGAEFEDVEAACFPGLDGQFDYRLLGPRHFEAVLTRTCQVLVRGEYGGALEAGVHYIPIERDFSNLDEVLALVRADTAREEMVERAYADIIASGAWTYRAFAERVFADAFAGIPEAQLTGRGASWWEVPRNKLDRSVAWTRVVRSCMRVFRPHTYYKLTLPAYEPPTPREQLRDMVVLTIGEERVWRFLVGTRNAGRRLTGKPPLEVGEYVPSEAERARRARRR